MTPAKALRYLLAFACALIVGWAFFDVAYRAHKRWQEDHERPVTLTVMHWGDQAENIVVQTLVKQFEAENPNVKIEDIAPGQDFRSKIKTMMAAGTPPDLFYLPPDTLGEWASLKLVAPIDEMIKQDIAEHGEPSKKLYDDFFPIIMDAYRFDTESGKIGKGPLYGLPKDFTTCVMYVNVDLFEKAGIPVPYNGWTWDEFEAAAKKITELTGKGEFKDRKVYGADFDIWPDTLREVLWTYGGDFFGNDFRDVAIDEPKAQAAIEMIRRMRFDSKTAYNNTGASSEGKQEFFTGSVGVIGPYGRWMTPRYASISNFKWDVVPVPYKTKSDQASQIFYTAWGMSTKSAHPKESFQLMKFLCGGAGALVQSRLGLAIPPLKSVAYSDDFLAPPGLPKIHAQVFLDAINYARLQQEPRDTELWNRIVDETTKRCIVLGQATPMEVANSIETTWHGTLDSPLQKGDWQPMRWDLIVVATIAVLVTLIGLLFWRAKREKLGPLDRETERTGYAFIMPWIVGFLVLTLGPMVVSLLLSFTIWGGLNPMSEARSVGTANYRELFTNDPAFLQSLKVTGLFVLLAVPVTQIAALGVAVLMNVKVRGIAVYRTIFFVPSLVVGSVVGAVLWRQMYNRDDGIINVLLRESFGQPGRLLVWIAIPLLIASAYLFIRTITATTKYEGTKRARPSLIGALTLTGVAIVLAIVGSILWHMHVPGIVPPDWLGIDAHRWAIPAFVFMTVWGVGGAMILYLAGLKGVPPSLYEAATIDGASKARQFWNVTLPMLSPLIFYNVVMAIIGSSQVFVQAMVMTGGGPDNATLFYVLNLYRHAFEYHHMGYASAMAWVLFVLLLGLTAFVFRASKNLVYYEGLKS